VPTFAVKGEETLNYGGESFRQDAFSPVRKSVDPDFIESLSSSQLAGFTTDVTDRSRIGALFGYHQNIEYRRPNQPVLAKRLDFYGAGS